MLASCENCRFSSGSGCTLGKLLAEGDLLCDRYEMTTEFKDTVLELMRRDITQEIQEAMLQIQGELEQGFAS